MMVKVCGITRREDAETAAEAGATALGFVFAPSSPRYVTPEQAAALAKDLPVWKVGIFVNETAASIEAVMRTAKLDIAQVYGDEAPASLRVWKAFRLAGAPASIDCAGAEAVLLDGLANGQCFDWALARDFAGKVIVAGGLDASNVADAIRAAKPWGVDASSGLESAPGVKDPVKVRRFVEAALKG
jgi:phosphoribosylanthranilate isomerase